jgi:hypothetical protein
MSAACVVAAAACVVAAAGVVCSLVLVAGVVDV